MTRAEAPFALRAQRQSLSPRNLERLRVPLGDLIDVLVEDDDGELIPGDAGVNLALTDDPRGLAVGIPLWANAQAFEEIEVYWGGSVAVIHFLSAAELDAPEGILYLRVPLRRLLDGQAEVSYTVWHLDGNSSESAAIRVLVKRTRPGGRDDDAEQPGHQGLVPAGLGDELIESGIGPIEAAAGVDVSIAAYEHMRVRDRIELDWGGERLVHVVAADEVGQDLTLVVEEALILAAGDGEIKMAWKVTDEVLNRSRDADERPWSASTTVEVYASDAQLYPPYVKIRDEYVDEVIDLNELDLDDVTVEVFTDPHHFAEGNWVELFWNGFTVEGERVQHRQQRQVERVPGAVTFMVPNGQAQVLGGGGRVVLYYQVKAGETTPPLHSSQRTTRRIEGEGAGVGLRAPTVLEAQGGHLDPTLAEATIRVAAYPGINIGDVLTVVFSGTRADGGEVYFDNTRNVTSGQIERGEILRGLPGEYIAALDGRRAEVYYLVNGRRSETLGLVIGELQATLQAPTVQEVAEGVLDPAAVGPQGASLEIPLYEGIALGDRVTYLWRGSEADGSTSDQSEITSLSEPLVFDVPKVFVEANLNGSVEVSYSVERDGHPGLVSRVFSFRVGVLALELDAPTVVQAPGGILDPLDALTGATVEVSYAGMSVSDQITLHWRGTAIAGSAELGPFAGDASGTLLIDIAAALVGANIGPGDSVVQISYSVKNDGAVEPVESPVLLLIVDNLEDLPAPVLPQAPTGILDLQVVSGHPTVTVAYWPFINEGQHVWLRVWGGLADGSSYPINVATGSLVTEADVNRGLVKAIDRSELLKLKNDSGLTIELKIGFDRTADESKAVECPTLHAVLKNELPALRWYYFVPAGWGGDLIVDFQPVTGFDGARFTRRIDNASTITYSSDQSAVHVDQSGVVTFLRRWQGTLTITARASDGRSTSYRMTAPRKWFTPPPARAYTRAEADQYYASNGLIKATRSDIGQGGFQHGGLWTEWGAQLGNYWGNVPGASNPGLADAFWSTCSSTLGCSADRTTNGCVLQYHGTELYPSAGAKSGASGYRNN